MHWVVQDAFVPATCAFSCIIIFHDMHMRPLLRMSVRLQPCIARLEVLKSLLGSILHALLPSDNLLCHLEDVGPVLKDSEWHVLSSAVADEIVALLCEEEVCLASCRKV